MRASPRLAARVVTGLSLAAAIAAAACDDSGTIVPSAEAGAGAGANGLVDPAVLMRGEYLVRSVAGCGECHTPRDANGNLDMSRWLGGVAYRFDVVPDDDTMGGISAPNLSPAALASVSDADIERAFLDGVGLRGEALYPLMPYYAYRNMTEADADAIVTYLRSIPPIDGQVPPRQPLPAPLDAPAPPLSETEIPHTTLPSTDARYASAERGRYLAGEIGFCLDCHTPWRSGTSSPLDMTRAFGGGRAFSAREWVVPPPAPPVIYSSNVTPAMSGLAGWTAQTVVNALHGDVDAKGQPLCRPMPSGPSGGLAGLSQDDAADIGVYLTTLPPIESGEIPSCP
jgi:mono/diheme cytochrome c family protein